jgi:hypothetical protein
MPSDRAALIPVPVTDKNGITSTKWKRPESTTKKTQIPAVQPAPFVSHWDTLRKDYRSVSKLLLNTTAHLVKAKYRRENMVAQLSPDTLNILNARYEGDLYEITPFIEGCIRDECLTPLNSAAALIDCAGDPCFDDPDSTNNLFFGFVLGLSRYQGNECVDYSLLDENERKVGKALMLSAATLGKNYISKRGWGAEAARNLKDAGLVSLIKRRPEDQALITSMILERGLRVHRPEDITMLEELLAESQLAPLHHGVL